MNSQKTILLVEDDVFLSSLLKTRLAGEGFVVTHVADGDAAIEALKTAKPDLIMLDIILPKKSGFEVMKIIQEDPQLYQSPIIIISNLGQESDIARGQELGAIEYFVKAKTPINELVERVKKYLAEPAGV